MISDPITCPYCNSQVPIAPPISRRLICPRCSESFPYRGPEPDATIATASPENSEPPPTVPPGNRRWSNGAIAGIVLVVMGTMVAITLTAALATEHVRRAHDFVRPERRPPLSFPLVLLIGSLVYFVFLIFHLVRVMRRPSLSFRLQSAAGIALMLLSGLALGDLFLIGAKASILLGWSVSRAPAASTVEQPASVQVVAPADLEGLGYLPAGTNAVLAVHVAQAAQTPAGRAFLERSQLAHSGIGMAEIQQATGLDREQIDHVVLGVRLDDSLPSPVMVVRTRQAFDIQKVRSALKARRHPKLGGKEVYEFQLPRSQWNALLWCPTDRDMVVTISRAVMEKLPLSADTGAERLAPPVRDFLKKRMRAGVVSWAAGQWNDGDTAILLLSSLLPADDRPFLTSVRTFGFWLRIDESIDVNAAMECADAAGAQALEKRLQERSKDGGFLQILGSGEPGAPVSRELARTLRLVQNGKWVNMQATADERTVAKVISSTVPSVR